MFILDTDIASLAFHEHAGVLRRLEAAPAPIRLSVITRLEVLRGRIEAVRTAADSTELLRAQEGLTRSEAFLSRFVVLPIDVRVGTRFDELRKNKKLKKIGRPDLLTACIALAHGATVVTRNLKDFQLVPNLRVENWAD